MAAGRGRLLLGAELGRWSTVRRQDLASPNPPQTDPPRPPIHTPLKRKTAKEQIEVACLFAAAPFWPPDGSRRAMTLRFLFPERA